MNVRYVWRLQDFIAEELGYERAYENMCILLGPADREKAFREIARIRGLRLPEEPKKAGSFQRR